MTRLGFKKLVVYPAVIGLLIFLHVLGILRPIENIVIMSLNPIFSGIHSISSGLRTTFYAQTSKTDLNESIRLLETQVVTLTEENARLNITQEENNILREHLEFLTKNKYDYIMSNVISRGDIDDLSNRTETIIIDKGKNDGLYSGLGVVSSQGVIVGKIIEARDTISMVCLTNSNQCKLAATVLNEEKTSGITEGELGLTIKMEFIPQGQVIDKDDIVVTSGLERSIPRGLIIGKVMEVVKANNELWQTAELSPMIDSEDLIIVSVLLP